MMICRVRRVDEFAAVHHASLVATRRLELGRELHVTEVRTLAQEAYIAASHLEDEARRRDGRGLRLDG